MLSAKLPMLQASPNTLRKSGEHLLQKQTCIGKDAKQHLFDCLLPLASDLFAGRVPKSTPHNIIWEVQQTNNKVEEWIESPQGASACASVERMVQLLGAPATKRKVVTRSTRMVAELVYELCSIVPQFCASSKVPLITVNQVVNAPSDAHASAGASMVTPVHAPFGFDPALKDEATGMNGTSELYPQRLCTALTCSMLHKVCIRMRMMNAREHYLHSCPDIFMCLPSVFAWSKAITRRAQSDGRVEWMLTLRDEIFRAIYADYMADFPAQRVHSARVPKSPSAKSVQPLNFHHRPTVVILACPCSSVSC